MQRIEDRHYSGNCGGDCAVCHSDQERDYYDRRHEEDAMYDAARAEEYDRYIAECMAEDDWIAWLGAAKVRWAPEPDPNAFDPDTIPF